MSNKKPYPYYCMTAMSRHLTPTQDATAAHMWFETLKAKGIPAAMTIENASGYGKVHNIWCAGQESGGERPNSESIEGHKVVKTCNGFEAFLQ